MIPSVAAALGVEPRDLAYGAPLRDVSVGRTDPKELGQSLTVHQNLTGAGTLQSASPTRQSVKSADKLAGTGVVHIPRLQANGGLERDVDLSVVSPDWVARWLPGCDPSEIRLLGAYGDAMAPTLSEGALVFVDTSKRVLDFDAIWVLRLRSTAEIWIRRVQRRPDGSWALLYDNTRYPPVIVPPSARGDFDVLGHVKMRGTFDML